MTGPLVLGIETSCDETGAGLVRGHELLADAIASSVAQHARFGGVVPEVASRAHLEAMVPAVDRALATAVFRPENEKSDVLTRKAVDACRAHGVDHLVIGGGVAANSRLRALAAQRCEAAGIELRVPRPGLCTDNGAMVAALGAELHARGAAASSPALAADSGLPVTTILAA
jgi:tRNA A37 threonylcarbamoyltransferase TsaD